MKAFLCTFQSTFQRQILTIYIKPEIIFQEAGRQYYISFLKFHPAERAENDCSTPTEISIIYNVISISFVLSLGWNQRLNYNLNLYMILTLLQWVLYGPRCYLCLHIKVWPFIFLCRLLWSEPCEEDPKRHNILVSSQIEIKTLLTFT